MIQGILRKARRVGVSHHRPSSLDQEKNRHWVRQQRCGRSACCSRSNRNNAINRVNTEQISKAATVVRSPRYDANLNRSISPVHDQRTLAVKQASLEPSFVPAQNMPSEISCVVGGYQIRAKPLPDTPALSDPRGTREANE